MTDIQDEIKLTADDLIKIVSERYMDMDAEYCFTIRIDQTGYAYLMPIPNWKPIVSKDGTKNASSATFELHCVDGEESMLYKRCESELKTVVGF